VLKQLDNKPFEHQGKAGMLVCPGYSCGLDSMLLAVAPWNAGYQNGFELHGIQMAPLLFGSMVIDGTGLSAFRTPDVFAGIKNFDGYLLVWYG